MRRQAQSSNNLGQIQDDLMQTVLNGLASEIPNWDVMPPEQKFQMAQERMDQLEGIQETANQAVEHAGQEAEMIDQMSRAAQRRVFDLSKVGQVPAGPSQLIFRDASQVRDYLEAAESIDGVISDFMGLSDDAGVMTEDGDSMNPRQEINDAVKTFMEGRDVLSEQDKLSVAMRIYDALPQAAKSEQQTQPSLPTQVSGVETVVADSNKAIRLAAIRLAKQRKQASGSFNMKKHAQHKASENLFFFGPDQTRIDPFTGDLASNYSAYERNKGFGLKVDDALDIDYETIWRGTVMDKYFRPYRDGDGNWVGGYIEKRFEVDKWIPEGNNLQLPPGQRRRAYVPEYRSTETRLQHLRSKEDDRGRVFNNTEAPTAWDTEGTTAKPFNLKMTTAASKKKVSSEI